VNAVSKLPERWQVLLRRRKNGDPYGDERNVMTALEKAPEFIGMLAYDEFADRVVLLRCPPWRATLDTPTEWTDEHRVELQAWLQGHGLPVARGNIVQDAAVAVAKRWASNPLRSYLTGLEWDCVQRIDRLFETYFGADGNPEYLAAIGPRILISAVARALDPGCKADHVLVLEGPQGIGKSTAVGLLGQPWTADSMPDLTGKDAALQIQGCWIVELAELTSMARSDVEHVKAFMSRNIDRYRPPYGRNAVDRPRHCIFIATTNLQEYLRDETGNRRFWPVRCRRIDVTRLRNDRDQLWAEAVHRWKLGVAWHLPPELEPLAQAEQESRRQVSEVEATLIDYLANARQVGTVFMRDLLRHVGGIEDFGKQQYQASALAAQFSRILVREGWEKLKPVGRGLGRRQPYQYRKPL
jgi:putative DNA primase/helicase